MPEQEDAEVTMWSESLFEGLFSALRRNQSDAKIRVALKELRAKGYEPQLIIEKVRVEIGEEGASVIHRIFKGGPAKKSKGGGPAVSNKPRSRPGARVYHRKSDTQQGGGFLDWLKGLFGRS